MTNTFRINAIKGAADNANTHGTNVEMMDNGTWKVISTHDTVIEAMKHSLIAERDMLVGIVESKDKYDMIIPEINKKIEELNASINAMA